MQKTMRGNDSITSNLAECYMTIDGERYNFLQLIDFEAKMNVEISEVPILGRLGKAHRPTGWDGEWSAKAHFNQSVIREFLTKYKNTALYQTFEIQVTNEDPTTNLGRQTIILKECLMDGTILTKFDADGEFLDEEISGTFDDFEIPEKFNLPTGMKA